MIFFPYKVLSFETTLTKEEFKTRLGIHAEFSRTKNFFTATTDDFLLETRVKGDEVLIKRKFGGRRTFPCKIVLSFPDKPKTTIKVRIVPKVIGFILCLPVVFLILIIPSPLIVKLFFIGLIYALGMIGFGFDIWWTKDLFEKKLLRIYKRGDGTGD
jgi:hypothetical protein